MPSDRLKAKIDALFPTDGVYAIENEPDDGGRKVVHRIVCVRGDMVHAEQWRPQHKHAFFEFFNDDLWPGIKVVRLDSFTNA